jgi:hypothetical protein
MPLPFANEDRLDDAEGEAGLDGHDVYAHQVACDRKWHEHHKAVHLSDPSASGGNGLDFQLDDFADGYWLREEV